MTTAPYAAPVPLYTAQHAANPQAGYDLLRQQGPVGVAEIDPGVLVYVITDYRAAIDLFTDPATWTKDTRGWMEMVPPDSPVRQLVEWRASLFFTDGDEHDHLRRVITDSFRLLDPHDIRTETFRHADTLLRGFAHLGEADLVRQYAQQLGLMILNTLFGMPDQDVAQLSYAIPAMVSTDQETRARGQESFGDYLNRLYEMKAARRGHDLTSWFIDHPNNLTPDEVTEQVVITLGAAFKTLSGLIANSLARMLSDDRYFSTLTTGSLPIRHAIEDVLWNDPPLAMYSLHFPRHDITFHGRDIQKGAPVMVSYAAANTCPHANQPQDGHRSGAKAHLAFAAGDHRCPARDIVFVVATAAIERLTSCLPDIELAVSKRDLTYDPDPIYRSLTSLPCRFTPLAADAGGSTPWSRHRSPEPSAPDRAPVPA